jgi:hypothetical protein
VDLNFAPVKPWQETSKLLAEVMDRTWKEKQDAQPRRPYLGGSIVGRDCEREIAYQYHATPKDEGKGFSGQLYRIFDRGHKGEDRMAEYLRVAGFELITHRQDGSQFGFSALDGRFKGHIDGAVVGGPPIAGIDYSKPGLWENKILNAKNFGDLWNHGLKKSKPVYYTQGNLYMAYMDLEWALFTAENADTCEVYAEILHFDAQHAQEMSDRAVRIIASQQPEDLVRCSVTPTDYRCKLCDYAARCWAEPAKPVAPKPAWLR